MMGKRILGIDIDEIIKIAINESLPSDEKSLQDKKTKQMQDFKAPKKDSDEIDEEAGEEVTKKVKAGDIVDLLNTMRSGKTLKDEDVRKNFQAYFDALSGSERVALFSFTQAIADIIAGENTPEDIKNQPQPEDMGVEISKDDEAPKQTTKKSKKAKSDDKEKDDSAPIIVGEAANKSKELKLIRRLK
tara:strand:+ start:155 stop:718 length:564 start_codon:yes stop_codon:yes gene_type:complete